MVLDGLLVVGTNSVEVYFCVPSRLYEPPVSSNILPAHLLGLGLVYISRPRFPHLDGPERPDLQPSKQPTPRKLSLRLSLTSAVSLLDILARLTPAWQFRRRI